MIELASLSDRFNRLIQQRSAIFETDRDFRDTVEPFAPPKSGYFYHYTSAAAFERIVSGKEFWGSSAEYMNDRTEHQIATRAFLHALETVPPKSSNPLEREFFDISKKLISNDSPASFVVSFSENPDQLSQWRAYCRTPDGRSSGGYALAIPASWLRLRARSILYSCWKLGPCVYSEADHHEIAVEVVSQLAQRASTASDARELTGANWHIGGICGQLWAEHRRARALFKHPSFHEEAEWRLVFEYPSFPADFGYMRVGFRPGPETLIPFRRFPLSDEPDRLVGAPQGVILEPITHVGAVIGPLGSIAPVRARLDALEFLRSSFPERSVWVALSRAPFRG